MTARYDIPDVRRGNSFTRTFRFKDSLGVVIDLTGSTLVFSIETEGAVLRKHTSTPGSGFAIDVPSSGEAVLALTPAETRTLKVGKTTRYEVERWIGSSETTLLAGCATVSEGLNDDD